MPIDASAPLLATPPLDRADGGVALVVRYVAGASRIATLRQDSPCRLLFPRVAAGAPVEAVLVNTGGGLVEGDRVRIDVAAETGASLVFGSQAAEKIYRSLTQTSRIEARLAVAEGARLAWRPQETILYDGARLERRLSADLAPGASLLAAETVMFGRAARGEKLTHGLLHDSWAIRIGGRLVWADAVRLEGAIERQRRRPFGFGEAAGYATIVHAGPDAASFLPVAREIAETVRAEAGASLVNGILVMRLLDADEARLRGAAEKAAARLAAATGW